MDEHVLFRLSLGVTAATLFLVGLLGQRSGNPLRVRLARLFLAYAPFLLVVGVPIPGVGVGSMELAGKWGLLWLPLLIAAAIYSPWSRPVNPKRLIAPCEAVMELLADSEDPAMVASQDRVVLACNRAAIDAFGFSRGELLGMPVRRIYATDEDYEMVAKTRVSPVRAVKIRGPLVISLRRKDGSVFQAQVLFNSFIEADVRQTIGVARPLAR